MLKFVVRRMLWTIPVILLVILFTFVLVRQIKGNPFRKTERAVPASIQRNLERKYHLDQPWYAQYAYYVKGVFTWDLGPSLVLRNQSVNDIVRDHFPVSAELGGLAILLAIIVGIPLGVLSALKANTSPAWCAARCSRRSSRTTSAPPARKGCAGTGSSGCTCCGTR
jgi:oligopeptide transport system permease protein